jgi:hypothetical protein
MEKCKPGFKLTAWPCLQVVVNLIHLPLPPVEMFRDKFRIPNFGSDPRACIDVCARDWKPLEVLALQAIALAVIFH